MRPRHFLPQLARPSHHHRLTLRLALHHRGLWAALTQAAAAAVVGSKFVATEVQLPQRWLLQVLDGSTRTVKRIAVNGGAATVPVSGPVTLAISGLTPFTTEPAQYELRVTVP